MGGSSGGGSSTTSIDTAYNSRMAAIAEEQQAMAQELFQYYKTGPGHWETTTTATPVSAVQPVAQPAPATDSPFKSGGTGGSGMFGPEFKIDLDAIKNLGTSGTGLTSAGTPTTSSTTTQWVSDPGAVSYMQQEQAQIKANLGLIPKQAELETAKINQSLALMPEQTKAGLAYYDTLNKGIDIDSRINQARADVSGAYAGADQSLRRWASKYGINPNSGAFLNQMGATERAKAAGLAGATTQARTAAEEEQYQRLASAMGLRSA